MPFPAQVFRILIASPSDVTTEREIAVRTIQEWNDINSHERQLVLLPLRWETHAAPEFGKRPQEVVNQQVVDRCDLLIGIFWTRIGTPTGTAESGTIEEIERVAKSRKPVMLYFSKAKTDPYGIDLEQLEKVRAFKETITATAYIQEYSDNLDFRDKLAKQLDIEIRSMLATSNDRSIDAPQPSKLGTDILIHFSEALSGNDLGTNLKFATTFVDVKDFDKLPDYSPLESGDNESKIASVNPYVNALIRRSDTNREYYRQRVTSFIIKEFFYPIRFWLTNRGTIGARDIYITFTFSASEDGVVLVPQSQLPTTEPSTSTSTFGLYAPSHPITPEDIISDGSTRWTTQLEVRALQPQRELSPPVSLYIGARQSCDISVEAKIFADTLPEPSVQNLAIHIAVEHLPLDANELLQALITPSDSKEEKP